MNQLKGKYIMWYENKKSKLTLNNIWYYNRYNNNIKLNQYSNKNNNLLDDIHNTFSQTINFKINVIELMLWI